MKRNNILKLSHFTHQRQYVVQAVENLYFLLYFQSDRFKIFAHNISDVPQGVTVFKTLMTCCIFDSYRLFSRDVIAF